MISEKIAGKFPDATEDEVATLTQEYFTEMAKAINPKAFQQQTGQSETRQRGKDEVVVEDWSAYLQPTEEQQQNSQQQQQSNESKAA